jgi:4-hydroxy-4-methyl-2-oxoglutarate aldolase
VSPETPMEPATGLVAEFARLGTATVHEAMGRSGAIDPTIAALWPGARVCGLAFTILCGPADNLMIHAGLARPGDGHVLVVATDEPEAGYWGLITTHAARAGGFTGLVIDGGVRDTEEIEALGFPVFARGRCIRGTSKTGVGVLNEPISIGGQIVRPGDLVLGDRDGLVVVPRQDAAKVLLASRARDKKEEAIIAAADRGELTADLLGLRAILEQNRLI